MVLLIKGVGRLDMSAAELLGEEAERRLNRLEVTRHLFDGSVFTYKGEAVASLFEGLSPDPCQGCTLRLYRECEGLAAQGRAEGDPKPGP